MHCLELYEMVCLELLVDIREGKSWKEKGILSAIVLFKTTLKNKGFKFNLINDVGDHLY